MKYRQCWIIWAFFILFVYIGGNYSTIIAVQLVGSTVLSSLQAIRLVATIIFSTILLGEGYKSYWEIIGTILTLISVTWFILLKNKEDAKAAQMEKMKKKLSELEFSKMVLEDMENSTESKAMDISLNHTIF